MNCWSILGVPADADERTIKRSYAALLKEHRPDEDLDAFQRLREAYERALTIARQRVESEGADDGDDVVVAPAAAIAHDQAQQARIEASLGDLAPGTLEAAAMQARDQGLMAQFERSLLERCLADNARGYAAAHWALAGLHWLTPWQEHSLPVDQLDGLLNRLLATELHTLHDLLAEGNEVGFQERLEVLFGQAWLQPFERRSYFSRQLVDVLLAVPRWSEEFFQGIVNRCQWSDALAREEGWPYEWHQLLRRVEQQGLHERITSRLNLRKPDSPQAKAAWLLFKPLSNGQRKRMVDGFTDKDWAGCQLLEETLQQEAPELLAELAPQGVQDWRRWLRSSQWTGVGVCLWLLLLGPVWLELITYGKDFSKAPAAAAFAAATMCSLMAGFLVVLHRVWRYCTGWLTRVDVAISELLLPASWTRQGAGVLIIRHMLPCVVIAGVVSNIGAKGGEVDWLSGAMVGVFAFVYADFNTKVGPPLVLLRAYLGRFRKQLNKVLVVAGLVLIALAIFWNSQQRGTQRLESLSEYSIPRFSGN